MQFSAFPETEDMTTANQRRAKAKELAQGVPASPIWDYGDPDGARLYYECETQAEWDAKFPNARFRANPARRRWRGQADRLTLGTLQSAITNADLLARTTL